MQKGKLGAKHFYPHIVWQKSGYGMRSVRWGPKIPTPVGVSAHYRQITHRYPLLVSAYCAHGPRTMASGPACMQRAPHTTASGSHTRINGPRPTLWALATHASWAAHGPRVTDHWASWADHGPRITASGPRPTGPAARMPVSFSRPTERGPWPDSTHWARRY